VGTEISLARARAEAGTRIPAHWHSQDTVAYLMDGRAVFRTGEGLNEVRVMEAGEWLFVPAGLVHEEESPDDVHFDFLYARDGGGGTTTFLDD
jgi:quercetin dioxygenase-like cupin family protein